MELTEKMIEIVRDRVASNRQMTRLLGIGEELGFEEAVAGLESIPAKNIEEARLMMEEEKKKMETFPEDSREYGEAFHKSQHFANFIGIIEEAEEQK